MPGIPRSAFTSAHASRCVKLTLPPVSSARCWFMSDRFSSNSRTEIVRTEVAVGTDRLACACSHQPFGGPTIGTVCAPARARTARSPTGTAAGAASAVGG